MTFAACVLRALCVRVRMCAPVAKGVDAVEARLAAHVRCRAEPLGIADAGSGRAAQETKRLPDEAMHLLAIGHPITMDIVHHLLDASAAVEGFMRRPGAKCVDIPLVPPSSVPSSRETRGSMRLEPRRIVVRREW